MDVVMETDLLRWFECQWLSTFADRSVEGGKIWFVCSTGYFSSVYLSYWFCIANSKSYGCAFNIISRAGADSSQSLYDGRL